MSAGKKKQGKSKKAFEAKPGPESDPLVLFRNYSKQCDSIGIPYNESIKRALCYNENEQSAFQLLIGDDEKNASYKPLGSWGCRALVAAILGKCNHGDVTKYTALKEIRIWRSKLGDHGTMAIAKLLREAGPEFNLNLLELPDNDIGVVGAVALGRSLCYGMMKSLVNLNLDYNSNLGSDGVAALAKGLSLNNTLKKLSLRYCQIDENGGEPLCKVLIAPKVALIILDLTGNRLGGKGLAALSPGIKVNFAIQKLNLSDNNILPKDTEAIKVFSDAITNHKSITDINLLYNTLGVEGSLALVNAVEGNKTINSIIVDTSLPSDIYSALVRLPLKGKASKKKSKKKKKK